MFSCQKTRMALFAQLPGYPEGAKRERLSALRLTGMRLRIMM
jgi:hypothetical protein